MTNIQELKTLAHNAITKKLVLAIDYRDVEKLIQEAYDVGEWSFVADNELGNDSDLELNIKAEPLDKWQQPKLDRFIDTKGQGSFMTRTLLTDLCNKGVLEPGSYLVSVSW